MQIKRVDRLLFICSLALLAAVIVFRLLPKEGKGIVPAQIVFAHYWDFDIPGEWITEFEEANPGVKVRTTPLTRADARELATKKPAEEESMSGACDVIALDGSWVSTARVNGTLYPLEEFTNQIDEWAVPIVSFMDVLYYNVDLLKAAGFDRPPSNREEFLVCARALNANGVPAMSFALGDAEGVRRDIYPWLWAAGASLTESGLVRFEGEAAAGVFDFLKSLKTSGFVPPGIFLAAEAEQLARFSEGKTAMLAAGIDKLQMLRGALDQKLGLTMIPGRSGFGKPGCAPRVWCVGVAAGCTHPKEAWALVTFIKGKAAAIAEKTTAVPGGGLAIPALEGDELYAKAWTIYEASEIYEASGLSPAVNAAVREDLLPLLEGTATGKETAADIDRGLGN